MEEISKTIAIINSSASYEPRAQKIGDFLKTCGYQVFWIESDFIHREKKKGRIEKKGHVYIDTVPYRKNISLKRLYSQYDFSKKVFYLLKEKHVDLLYVMLPANSLALAAVKIKKKQHTKLVFDIIDLWPESLPIKGIEWFWPVQWWRKLRDNHLSMAELVVTECALYQQLLHLEHQNTATLYWTKNLKPEKLMYQNKDTEVQVVYLGSINNIIDIDMILDILVEVNQRKPVTVHIIGDGEKRDFFMEKLREHHIQLQYHGIVYDEEEKKKIFSQCSWGINIMKPGVCVGLTMKSIDYFCYGLPFINNIPGDTWQMIERYKIGVNCEKGDSKKTAEEILSISDNLQQRREQMQELYCQLFTPQALESVLKDEVLPLLKEEM